MTKKTKPSTRALNAQANDGFSYSRNYFEGLVDSALKHAKKIGATDAGAEAVSYTHLTLPTKP
jgi:PmbA protein